MEIKITELDSTGCFDCLEKGHICTCKTTMTATWQEQYIDALNADYHSGVASVPVIKER